MFMLRGFIGKQRMSWTLQWRLVKWRDIKQVICVLWIIYCLEHLKPRHLPTKRLSLTPKFVTNVDYWLCVLYLWSFLNRGYKIEYWVHRRGGGLTRRQSRKLFKLRRYGRYSSYWHCCKRTPTPRVLGHAGTVWRPADRLGSRVNASRDLIGKCKGHLWL